MKIILTENQLKNIIKGLISEENKEKEDCIEGDILANESSDNVKVRLIKNLYRYIAVKNNIDIPGRSASSRNSLIYYGCPHQLDGIHYKVTPATIELQSFAVIGKKTIFFKDLTRVLKKELSPIVAANFYGDDSKINSILSASDKIRILGLNAYKDLKNKKF